MKVESEISGPQETTYEIESYTLRNTASFLVALCISSYLSVAFLKQGKLKTAGISAATIATLKSFLSPKEWYYEDIGGIDLSTFLRKKPPSFPVPFNGLTFYFKYKYPIKFETAIALNFFEDSSQRIISDIPFEPERGNTNELEITIERDPKFQPAWELKVFAVIKDGSPIKSTLELGDHVVSFPCDGDFHSLSVHQLFQKKENNIVYKKFFSYTLTHQQ